MRPDRRQAMQTALMVLTLIVLLAVRPAGAQTAPPASAASMNERAVLAAENASEAATAIAYACLIGLVGIGYLCGRHR